MRLEPEQAYAQLERVDERPLPDADEVRAFMVVRDEGHRLPHVIAHHRALGVARFLVVDNGSRDGSRDWLRAQPDVHLWTTSSRYGDANFGFDWTMGLLERHGRGRWCLIVDGDEQLVYPHVETLSLPALCRALDEEGATAAAAFVLDMYGPGPILETAPEPGRPLLDTCPWFDRDAYEVVPAPGRVPPWMAFGGPRARLFWSHLEATRRSVDAWIDAAPVGSSAVPPPPSWKEGEYLAAHPDVAAQVRRGAHGSGFEHYVRQGRAEGRSLTLEGPPCLTNVPLVRWSAGLRYESGRHAFEEGAAPRLSRVRVALLHFRLMADLAARARRGLDGATPAPGAETWFGLDCWRQELETYLRALERDPRPVGEWERSERYTSSARLCDLGLLVSSPGLDRAAEAAVPAAGAARA